MRRVNNLFSSVYRKGKTTKESVLGINASPRAGGNSDIILDRVLSSAGSLGFETNKLIINDFKFTGCQSCSDVRDDGYCAIDDDFQKIYSQIKQSQIIVLSSPIFFGSITAQAKAMIDRFQCHWRAAHLLKKIRNTPKKGYFLSVQADNRKDYFDNAALIVRNFFATAGIKYCGEIFCYSADAPGSINEHLDILEQADALARSFSDQS